MTYEERVASEYGVVMKRRTRTVLSEARVWEDRTSLHFTVCASTNFRHKTFHTSGVDYFTRFHQSRPTNKIQTFQILIRHWQTADTTAQANANAISVSLEITRHYTLHAATYSVRCARFC